MKVNIHNYLSGERKINKNMKQICNFGNCRHRVKKLGDYYCQRHEPDKKGVTAKINSPITINGKVVGILKPTPDNFMKITTNISTVTIKQPDITEKPYFVTHKGTMYHGNTKVKPQTDKTTEWENRVTELAENIFMGGCVAKTEYDKLGASNARRAIKDLKQLIAELSLAQEAKIRSEYEKH